MRAAATSPGPTTRRSGIRALIALLVTIAILAPSSPALAGGRAEAASRRVSGGLEGTFTGGTPTLQCPLGTPTFVGTVEPEVGPDGTLEVRLCLNEILFGRILAGTASFTLTAPGGTLSGTGAFGGRFPPFPGGFTLTVVSATGSFHGLTGTLSVGLGGGRPGTIVADLSR